MAFVIVIDSSEQEPYEFDCKTERAALPTGDYSVLGKEALVTVERKSIQDLVKTLTHDQERFQRELTRMHTFDAACVVVEWDLDEALSNPDKFIARHNVHPHSIMGICHGIFLEHGISIFWCGSRPAARAFTESFLRMFVQKKAGLVFPRGVAPVFNQLRSTKGGQ